MSRVVLIPTGGTIASTENRDARSVNANLDARELFAMLSAIPGGVDVGVRAFASVNSFALGLDDAFQLCREIEAALAEPDVRGVVVTHGTDTMEESAYLSDLLVTSEKPVVFTGAQRHAGQSDTDGPRNLHEAILCAASSTLRGCGTVVLFEGDIHAARDVSKTHTARVDAFRSAGLGKLGEVDAGMVFLYRNPAQRCHIRTDRLESRVELMLLGLGSSPSFLEHCLQTGVRGVVLSAFGRGNAPRGIADTVKRLAKQGIPTVVASRCAEGRTLPVYGGDSGGVTLELSGALFSGTLSAVKARLLTSASLGAGGGIAELTQHLAMANKAH